MKTLGLDIGTTSISSVIFREKTGVLEAKTIANGTFLSSESWERLQNPAAIWQKAFRVVSELLQRHPDVRAIGVTGQMHGILYLNADGEAASPLYTWQDGRGDLPFDETNSWAEHLSAITAHPLSTGYGMVTHFYNLRHRLVPEDAVCLCTIGDYIAMKLAGLTRPRIEPTNGASLGLFDLGKRRFDAEALLRAEMDEAFLPEIANTTLLGTGALGIPVYAAIGDNQAAFLGAVGGSAGRFAGECGNRQSGGCIFLKISACARFGNPTLPGWGMAAGGSLPVRRQKLRSAGNLLPPDGEDGHRL